MSKLRDQFSINDRLREYIERMLTVILENNPQLLEVTTSSGVSIMGGMPPMSSMKPQQQSSLTKTETKSVVPKTSIPTAPIQSDSLSKKTETKSVLPKLLTPTASIKSDSSSTTTKEQPDKYCRL
jgi:hypothetical protein